MSDAMTLNSIIGLAVLIDLLCGDPRNRFHPVAAMGKYIHFLKSRSPQSGNFRRFCWGTVMVCSGMLLSGGIGWLILRGCGLMPLPLSIMIQAVALKMTFSLRSLIAAGRAVLVPLQNGDLAAARQMLGRHLVSRKTEELTDSEVAGAAIESLAENLTDSFVAPLCCYLLGGLPAAVAYRYLNTCDAMLGYRTPEYEWLGKFAARCDDVVNWLPARIAAVCLWFAVLLRRGHAVQAATTWWNDRSSTTSPNAGQTMSLTAGGLGVVLVKPDDYRLGDGLREPTADNLRRALGLLGLASFLFVITIVIGLIVWGMLS